MENEKIIEIETAEVEVNEEVKKVNFATKVFGAIKTGAKATGSFMKKHAGAIVTTGVVIVGGVVYYLVKNGLAEDETVAVDMDDDSVTFTEDETDNIVEFDKAANE